MEKLLEDRRWLLAHIRDRLLRQQDFPHAILGDAPPEETDASVLFLLGSRPAATGAEGETCLIFTQRSRYVRQPGDLCFPGGGLSPRLDTLLSGLLKFPGFPLFHWPSTGRQTSQPRGMARFLATSLRESFEEMRLNPLRVRFLGPMAPEWFPLAGRMVYPMVAWTDGQRRFILNREVEKIVRIPLRHFFRHEAYGRLPAARIPRLTSRTIEAMPCLIHETAGGIDLLWGITYRIVMRFLAIVFDFRPPQAASLPIVPQNANHQYRDMMP